MAALLVGMSVAAILMTAAMPTWKQMARREKEAELIFRGQQYARAIGLFQRRSGPGVLPPNLDVLVEGRFLRKKYKDPITGEDFDLLTPTQGAAGVPTAGRGAGGQQQGGGTQQPGRGTPPGAGPVVAPAGGRGGAGGIIGVVSKSTETSIRVYNGRTKYNEWQFMYVAQTQAPEAPGAAGGVPGGRGSRAGGPGSPTAPGGFGPGAGRPGGRGPGRGAGPDGGQGRGGLQPGGLNGQPRAPIFGGPSPFGPQTPR